ncbi:MAG: hypothetical protein FJZ87_08930 [Chloroflexi bacterium]|nr:hypothetical protein [Chloroflexota bacterium]
MKSNPAMGPPARKLILFFTLLLCGPLIGLSLAVFNLALAPSWTFMTNTVAPAISCLVIPIGLLFLIVQKLNPWLKAGLAFLLIIIPLVYMTLLPISGGKISGMTSCSAVDSSGTWVQYDCVSTSSDDADFRYEFVLQGWKGFPVMHVIEK